MSIYKEVIVSTGEYQNAEGQTKQRWAKCGIVVQKPNGDLRMKLDLFPQWFILADPKPREGLQREQYQRVILSLVWMTTSRTSSKMI